MRQFTSILLCVVYLYATSLSWAAEKARIGVLELAAHGVSVEEVRGLTDRLRTELFQTGRFEVVERERMTEILQEQGFQQSGACNTDVCVVEVGKLIGAEQMIAGSVSKIGQTYSVNLRLIDVERGVMVRTAMEDSPGPIDQVLKETMKRVAWQLVGVSEVPSIPPSRMPNSEIQISTRSKEFTILSDSVNITATLDSVSTYENYKGGKSSDFIFQLTIEHKNDRFKLSTTIFGVKDLNEAIVKLRKTIGWKDGYLFVLDDCGLGNAWRCRTDRVFAIRQGQLIFLGKVLGGDQPGEFYKDGYFVDVYDKFESNNVTDHARAPGIRIFLQERDGYFQVDLNYTWLKNYKNFVENTAEFERIKGQESEYTRTRGRWVFYSLLTAPLLSKAVLAKYCHHDEELQEVIRVAEAVLTSEMLADFSKILSAVVPGERPKEE